MNLPGLEQVPWSQLVGRQGPDSSMVPDYLRALASGDAAAQRDAAVSLSVTLLHDGDHAVFPVTPAAIPFLRMIACERGLAGRTFALELLRAIATFRGDAYLLEGVRVDELEATPDSFPFNHSILAVAAGQEDYLALATSDADPAVRALAASLVGILITQRDPRAELATALANESDGRARASLALALALQMRVRGGAEIEPFDRMLGQSDTLSQQAAVLATGLALGSAMSDAQLERLEDLEATPFAKDFDFWHRGLLDDFAAHVLEALPS